MALASIAIAPREGDAGPGVGAGGSGQGAGGSGQGAGGSGQGAEGPGHSAEGPGMGVEGLKEGIVRLTLPEVPISSSLVRARTAAGESLDGFVPPAVAAYIAEHALYARAGVPAS
jgi:hypothetical protein